MKERDFIRKICSRIGFPPSIPVGPGDDLAVLDIPAGKMVFGIDSITEGIDFYPNESPDAPSPISVGRKAALVNLSDIAAMGAEPFCMVASATIRKGLPDDYLQGIYAGLLSVEKQYGLYLVGGDITASTGPTTLTVAVLGSSPYKQLLRSGALPGDYLFVTGVLGGSILGKHLEFAPRIAEGLYLAKTGLAESCIDISDGLSTDARHIAEMSNVNIDITETAIPVSGDAFALSGKDGKSALYHAINDGEDFELLFTVRRDNASRIIKEWPFETPLTMIGSVREPDAGEQPGGVFIIGPEGREPLPDKGYEHEI